MARPKKPAPATGNAPSATTIPSELISPPSAPPDEPAAVNDLRTAYDTFAQHLNQTKTPRTPYSPLLSGLRQLINHLNPSTTTTATGTSSDLDALISRLAAAIEAEIDPFPPLVISALRSNLKAVGHPVRKPAGPVDPNAKFSPAIGALTAAIRAKRKELRGISTPAGAYLTTACRLVEQLTAAAPSTSVTPTDLPADWLARDLGALRDALSALRHAVPLENEANRAVISARSQLKLLGFPSCKQTQAARDVWLLRIDHLPDECGLTRLVHQSPGGGELYLRAHTLNNRDALAARAADQPRQPRPFPPSPERLGLTQLASDIIFTAVPTELRIVSLAEVCDAIRAIRSATRGGWTVPTPDQLRARLNREGRRCDPFDPRSALVIHLPRTEQQLILWRLPTNAADAARAQAFLTDETGPGWVDSPWPYLPGAGAELNRCLPYF